MRSKKGQGVTFNWIFVLVAGAVILTLFIYFIVDFKNLFDRKKDTELALELDQKLEALSTSTFSAEIDPEGVHILEAEFNCKEFTIFKSNPIQYNGKYVFAPSEVKADKFTVWLEEFSFPYTVANLIYIIPDNIKYYVVNDQNTQELTQDLLSLIPQGVDGGYLINIKVIDSVTSDEIFIDIKNENLREIKFLLFSNQNLPNFPIKASKIIIENSDHGIVNINGEQSYYFSKPLIFGALISDNYECVLSRLVDRVSLLNEIHKDKTLKLFSKVQVQQPECNYQLLLSTYPNSYEDYPLLYDKQTLMGIQNEGLFKKGCLDVF